ncbi:MAG: nucleotide exchange factor GrpE, partial [Patescibacteria group bacterium]|nr:nucleotide exchange factor GrpE [Patescibacteria group bacterium]
MGKADDQKGPKVTIKQKGPRIERDPAKDAEEQAQQQEQPQQRPAQPAQDDDRAKDLKEQMARLQADFTNFKKRMEKDRLQTVQDAHGDLAVQLLPVIDNFDRAAEHVPEAIKEDQWYVGV